MLETKATLRSGSTKFMNGLIEVLDDNFGKDENKETSISLLAIKDQDFESELILKTKIFEEHGKEVHKYSVNVSTVTIEVYYDKTQSGNRSIDKVQVIVASPEDAAFKEDYALFLDVLKKNDLEYQFSKLSEHVRHPLETIDGYLQ